jgi:hypothetical protein
MKVISNFNYDIIFFFKLLSELFWTIKLFFLFLIYELVIFPKSQPMLSIWQAKFSIAMEHSIFEVPYVISTCVPDNSSKSSQFALNKLALLNLKWPYSSTNSLVHVFNFVMLPWVFIFEMISFTFKISFNHYWLIRISTCYDSWFIFPEF